jgi:threonine/homoserine/homoserine lactone efflux protein
MEFVIPVVLGFLISFVATALPGLLNMTAAKVSLKDGRNSAKVFALGASTVVFVQAYLAVSFAKIISRSPELIAELQEIGVCIFTVLTIFFFFFAKKKKKKKKHEMEIKPHSKVNRYFMGAMLSALNFFPIPFYVFVTVSFSRGRLILFTALPTLLFVLGIVAGAYTVFYLYIVSFKKFEHKTEFFMRNVNYFIGSITGIIAIVTLIKILRNQ